LNKEAIMYRNISLLSALAASLLIASAAAAQRVPATEYSANTAAMSPTMSAEARQAMNERTEAVNAKFRAAHGGLGPEQFGLQCCQITQFPAASFTTKGPGGHWDQLELDYLYRPSGSAAYSLWAPVLLPTGVEIEYLDLYYSDSNSSFDIVASLIADTGGAPSSGSPDQTALATAQSNGSSGYGYAFALLTYTVNNNVAYDPAAGQLNLAVSSEVSDFTNILAFRGADLWWMRQVSPAPATATFTDVPTNHQFFQFVEALAASGVSVGYPDGRFGVDDPITRGQMAVFLAKALGLYWPF
jgi:S-layer family protein